MYTDLVQWRDAFASTATESVASLSVSLTTSVPTGASTTGSSAISAATVSSSVSGSASSSANQPSPTSTIASTTAAPLPSSTGPPAAASTTPASSANGRVQVSYGATAIFGLVLLRLVLWSIEGCVTKRLIELKACILYCRQSSIKSQGIWPTFWHLDFQSLSESLFAFWHSPIECLRCLIQQKSLLYHPRKWTKMVTNLTESVPLEDVTTSTSHFRRAPSNMITWWFNRKVSRYLLSIYFP